MFGKDFYDFYFMLGNNHAQNISNVASGVMKKIPSLSECGILKRVDKFLFVGSGYSTKKNIQWIREKFLQGYFIIAVPTAASYLFSEGLFVWGIFCNDCREATYETLRKVRKTIDASMLIINSHSHPELFTDSVLKGNSRYVYSPMYPSITEKGVGQLAASCMVGGEDDVMVKGTPMIINCVGDTGSTMIGGLLDVFLKGDGKRVDVAVVGLDYGWEGKKGSQRVPMFKERWGELIVDKKARPEDDKMFEVEPGIFTTEMLDKYFEINRSVVHSVNMVAKGKGKEVVWENRSLRK